MRKIIFLTTLLTSLFVFAQEGSLDMSFNPSGIIGLGIKGLILQPDEKILISEDIGQNTNKITRLNSNGSLDNSFNSALGTGGFCRLAALQSDGKILVIGSFNLGNKLFRLNPDGSLDANFISSTGANDFINTLELLPDGKIIIGGMFTFYNGLVVNHLVRLKSDGSIDTNINLGTIFSDNAQLMSVDNMDLLPDGKFLAQMVVYSIDWNYTIYFIVRLNSNWTLDNSFAVNDECSFYPIKIQSDGKIIKQETCIDWNWVEPPYQMLNRLNTDGTYDSSFYRGGVDGGYVDQFSLLSEDKILATGSFTSYNGIPANHIAKLNPDGTLDDTFDAGSGPNNSVYEAVSQFDGKTIIVGDFTTYNGVPANHIARINTTQLSLNEFEENQFTLFPNPVNDILEVSISDKAIISSYEIYDINSKKLVAKPFEQKAINVTNLSEGIYFLKLLTADTVLTAKFIKN